MLTIRKAADRGHAQHDWLDAHHSFSFADYYDPRWRGFRSLRVLNDDTIAGGGGFGPHPHRDMEILTYVLSGALAHQDSMGNRRVIRSGEVQYMAAGTGVEHSEFNDSATEPVHLLQMWLVPDCKGAKPAYAERSFAQAPAGRLLLVASKSGREGSIALNQDADVWLAKLATGDSAQHRLRLGRHAWVHVAAGRGTINNQTVGGGDAAMVSEEAVLELNATQPTQVLLFDLN